MTELSLHRSRVATAAALLAASLLTGCAPLLIGTAVVGGAMVATDRRTSGSLVDDEVIEIKAGGRIGEVLGDRGTVTTTSYNRMVLLTGEVPAEADKARAEQVVARIDNVKAVVNEVTVGPMNTFGERSRDVFVASKVKASIVDAKDLLANTIKVVVHRSVVYLMGRVTEREAERASEVARGVSGVAKVVRVFEVVGERELAGRAPLPTAAASAPAGAPIPVAGASAPVSAPR
jgi:osmotically-inducible protein OsmY